jgi:hypothetical protein
MRPHQGFLGFVIGRTGGVNDFVGPFGTQAEAVAAVQAELRGPEDTGGVFVYEAVAFATPETAASDDGDDDDDDAADTKAAAAAATAKPKT